MRSRRRAGVKTRCCSTKCLPDWTLRRPRATPPGTSAGKPEPTPPTECTVLSAPAPCWWTFPASKLLPFQATPAVLRARSSTPVRNTSAAYPTVDAASRLVTTVNIPTRCFPENYLLANPQLNSAIYNANLGRNNYHSLQTQFTMRPWQGISFQSTYTWSKSMGLPSFGYNDPANREFDRHKGN